MFRFKKKNKQKKTLHLVSSGKWASINTPINQIISTQDALQLDFDFEFDLEDTDENILDGCFCKKCEEFFPYSVPNQDDGTMVCWSCRNFWI